jgi:hypothetical protein
MEPEGSLPHLKVPAAVCTLSQLNPVHAPTSHFLKMRFNIRVSHQNPAHTSSLPHTRYMPAHLILLDFITRLIVGEEYRY